MASEISTLVRQLNRIPGVYVGNGGKHYKVFKDGVAIYSLPMSPSDRNFYKAALRDLRKMGVIVDEEQVEREKVSDRPRHDALRNRVIDALVWLGWPEARGAQTAFCRTLLEEMPYEGWKPATLNAAQQAVVALVKHDKPLSASMMAAMEAACDYLDGKEVKVESKEQVTPPWERQEETEHVSNEDAAFVQEVFQEMIRETRAYFDLPTSGKFPEGRGVYHKVAQWIINRAQIKGHTLHQGRCKEPIEERPDVLAERVSHAALGKITGAPLLADMKTVAEWIYEWLGTDESYFLYETKDEVEEAETPDAADAIWTPPLISTGTTATTGGSVQVDFTTITTQPKATEEPLHLEVLAAMLVNRHLSEAEVRGAIYLARRVMELEK